MAGRYRSFAHRVDVGAPVQRVWRAFTDSAVLARWTAPGAQVTPRQGGRLHVPFGRGIEVDAHIDVMVTPQRLRLILLPVRGMPGADAAKSDAASPGAVIVEDFLFEAGRDDTTIRLLSSGVPSLMGWVTYYQQQRRHWELALNRLKVLLEKGLDDAPPAPRF